MWVETFCCLVIALSSCGDVLSVSNLTDTISKYRSANSSFVVKSHQRRRAPNHTPRLLASNVSSPLNVSNTSVISRHSSAAGLRHKRRLLYVQPLLIALISPSHKLIFTNLV